MALYRGNPPAADGWRTVDHLYAQEPGDDYGTQWAVSIKTGDKPESFGIKLWCCQYVAEKANYWLWNNRGDFMWHRDLELLKEFRPELSRRVKVWAQEHTADFDNLPEIEAEPAEKKPPKPPSRWKRTGKPALTVVE